MDKGEFVSDTSDKKSEDRQYVFSPEVSSPTRYKDTGNRSTSFQQRRKNWERDCEKEEREKIHNPRRKESRQ